MRLLDWITGRKRAYQLTFGGPVARDVLKDLAKFCRANETCFHSDPRIHAALEGRREVWNRIQGHLNLSPNELLSIYNPGQPIEGLEK
jgi:hypothetical protein